MRLCRICGEGQAPTTMCKACGRSWDRWARSRTDDGSMQAVALWAAGRARRAERRRSWRRGLADAALFAAGFVGSANQGGRQPNPKQLHDGIVRLGADR
jgi:hypothetical protein